MIKEKKGLNSSFYYISAIFLILIAIVLVVLFFLHGETTYINNDGSVDLSLYLSCESNKVDYIYYIDKQASEKNLRINATFKNNEINSISLIYYLKYSGDYSIREKEAVMHAAMNKAFDKYSLGADAFGATYSKIENGVQLSLYADKADINGISLGYFMLDNVSGVYTRDKVTKQLTSKGLDCLINN